MDMPLLIAIFVFLAVIAAIAAFASYSELHGLAKRWRARAEGATSGVAQSDEEAEKSGLQYFQGQVVSALERMGSVMQPKEQASVSALRRSLIIAGYRKRSAPTVFFGVKLLFGAGLPLIALLVPNPWMADMSQVNKIGIYVFLAVAGIYGPELWLGRMVTRRKGRLLDSFPDALDLLVVCVEAGLGLDAAVDRCGKELWMAHPELAQELEILSLELRAGLPREQALTNLGDRVDLDEVRSLVALLIQTDRFGTSIGQALRVYSDAMRSERSLRAEEMAAKLPVKMLFPLMFFIFPSLFIVILGPAIVQGVRVLLPALQTGG